MKRGIVIFYGECLSSYLLYAEIIQKHPSLVQCIVRFPIIPRKKKNDKTKMNPNIFNKILQSSKFFLLFNFFTISYFNFFAYIFGNSIEKIAKKNKIDILNYSHVNSELINELKKFNPYWILNNSSIILKNNIIDIPHYGIINYHCAKLPQYRGAANIFWALYNSEKEINGTFHYVNEKIDAGDIILETDPIAIDNNISAFKLWYAIRKEAYVGWKKIIQLMKNEKKIPSKKQNNAESVLRSFPNESILRSIRKSGHSFLTISDIVFITKVAITGKIR
ncbi:MAG: hypothetical protein CML28_02880 [Rhizobiales bacterium]|nr:hypothetical protein [Hyphomicrobiales bacterium]